MSTKKPKIVLIGDSILDNSYWDNVKNKNTGQVLAKLTGKKAKILDHSTEELTSKRLLQALRNKVPVQVGLNYVQARKNINYPYPGRGGKIPVTPKALKLGKDSVVFLSIGGNDIVLEQNLNISEIMRNIKAIAKIYKNSGAKFVYIIPYPPTQYLLDQIGDSLGTLYKNMIKLVHNSGLDYISLEDFGDSLRRGPTLPYQTGIPEPTVKGARELAKRIAKKSFSIFPSSKKKSIKSRKKRSRKKRTCSICGKTGHNKRTCQNKSSSKRSRSRKIKKSKRMRMISKF